MKLTYRTNGCFTRLDFMRGAVQSTIIKSWNGKYLRNEISTVAAICCSIQTQSGQTCLPCVPATTKYIHFFYLFYCLLLFICFEFVLIFLSLVSCFSNSIRWALCNCVTAEAAAEARCCYWRCGWFASMLGFRLPWLNRNGRSDACNSYFMQISSVEYCQNNQNTK